MTYHFRIVQEVFWVAVVSAAAVLLQALVIFDPDQIDNWQIWATGLGAAGVRAVAASLIAWATARGTFTQR